MRSLMLIVASFAVTILCWGVYGPVLHWGQEAMVTEAGQALGMKYARWRPFVCVGLAYFAIGVAVPALLLRFRGERGAWTTGGVVMSLLAGALGALGALGIILAFNFGGKPVFVMPLVFGGAPVINSFLTIYWSQRLRDIGPMFQAGLVMVVLGAATVLLNAPSKPPTAAAAEQPAAAPASADQPNAAPAADASAAAGPAAGTTGSLVAREGRAASRLLLQLLAIGMTAVCWGCYGPTLHRGQAAMQQSRLRPLLCVGLAYFVIAVIVPNLWLAVQPEESVYNFSGTAWSLAGGAAGALGALGIIMAFNFGGKPIYVMPLVFGGAPVVNTLTTTLFGNLWSQINPFFLAGLILVVAGAAMVLVFAPKSGPHGAAAERGASAAPPQSAPAGAAPTAAADRGDAAPVEPSSTR